MTKQELVKIIIENFKKDGVVDLTDLDFSEYDVSVNTSNMKVNGNLYQHYQKVEGKLWQSRQQVGGRLYQDYQTVGGDLWQNCQQVGGNLFQGGQKVDGKLFQHSQKVGGDLHQDCQKVKGDLHQDRQTVGFDLHQDRQTVKGNLLEQKTMVFNGKEYKVDFTDGYYGGIVEEHTKMGLTFKTLIETFGTTLYLVSNGNFSYHSDESFEDAVQGLKNKIKVFNEDVKPKLEAIKAKGTITREDYRNLTGACEAGTNAFCERVGIGDDVESITLQELKDKLLPTDYGYDRAKLLWFDEKDTTTISL